MATKGLKANVTVNIKISIFFIKEGKCPVFAERLTYMIRLIEFEFEVMLCKSQTNGIVLVFLCAWFFNYFETVHCLVLDRNTSLMNRVLRKCKNWILFHVVNKHFLLFL